MIESHFSLVSFRPCKKLKCSFKRKLMVFSILMPLTGAVKQQIFGSLSDSLFFKPAQPNTQIIYELGKVKYLNTFECAVEATEGQNSGWALIQLRYFDETGLAFNSAEIWRSNYPLHPVDSFSPTVPAALRCLLIQRLKWTIEETSRLGIGSRCGFPINQSLVSFV